VTRKPLILAMAALVVGLAILGQGEVPTSAASDGDSFEISILSSSPDRVSGGDALVRVDVPTIVPLHQVTVELNGDDVSGAFAPEPQDHALVGLVDGLVLGENTLEAKPNGQGEGRPDPAQLSVTNHPITGPIFSGPQQQPFVCTTARAGLGQPLVDNMDEIGIPVAQEDAEGNYPQDGHGYPTEEAVIVGWSEDCSAETRVEYVYRTTDDKWKALEDLSAPLPEDIAYTTTMDDDTVPYIVRWERGTINRFIYSLAMLAPTSEQDPSDPDRSLWNGRLIYSFQGGVGIGHSQGNPSTSTMLLHDGLSLGYAVAYSTGNIAGVHYNLQVGGETALMVKERFIERYGVPYYTVGVGGSGGAIQQYVYGQNHPSLLDAAVPQYSYPDMVTQTIHVGDCELLEYYMDVTDRDNPKWFDDVENRQLLQGLNASWDPQNLSPDDLAQWNTIYFLYGLLGYPVAERAPWSPAPALTECRNAWFGLAPLVLNPTFTDVDDIDKLAQGTEGVEWTHWADLVNIYGTDESGFARVPWDNVGVQYGLQALVDGNITPEEFLHLNATVGSWKESKDLVTEGFPFVGGDWMFNFDPWSSRNMNLSPDGGITPAPRREGDIQAMNAAYDSGVVFDGKINIPIIDWRHYLEDELDMHHTHQSFASRQRMIEAQGHADNQVIWFTDARPFAAWDQTAEAFQVIDEWMANIKANPDKSVAENKPPLAVDRCFNTDGSEFASGDDVWDGILNGEPAGLCTQKFQIYSSSRIVSGGPLKGGIFKCQLQPVGKAIAKGVYGTWEPDKDQKARLKEIFPTGVCDYSLPDAGRPAD